MTTQHTPEPWILTPCKHANDTAFIIGADGKNVSWVDCEYYNNIRMEDNKRIVACVNACAGWETGDLAERADGISMTLRELFDGQRDVIIALRQQRDDLLEQNKTLRAAQKACETCDPDIYELLAVMERARDLIELVETPWDAARLLDEVIAKARSQQV